MSGSAQIGENFFFELDICYNLDFYKDNELYSSVYSYVEKNKEFDTVTSLTLVATIAKFESNLELLNKLIQTKDLYINYPFNNSHINYALILLAIRAYFQGNIEEYNNYLLELGC